MKGQVHDAGRHAALPRAFVSHGELTDTSDTLMAGGPTETVAQGNTVGLYPIGVYPTPYSNTIQYSQVQALSSDEQMPPQTHSVYGHARVSPAPGQGMDTHLTYGQFLDVHSTPPAQTPSVYGQVIQTPPAYGLVMRPASGYEQSEQVGQYPMHASLGYGQVAPSYVPPPVRIHAAYGQVPQSYLDRPQVRIFVVSVHR
jgi:hypothetical protein